MSRFDRIPCPDDDCDKELGHRGLHGRDHGDGCYSEWGSEEQLKELIVDILGRKP